MSQNEIDKEILRIMLENPEYAELDCIFAVNGMLMDNAFGDLADGEQDDIIRRLAIGVQIFNAHLDEDMKQLRDWRSLPKVEIKDDDEES